MGAQMWTAKGQTCSSLEIPKLSRDLAHLADMGAQRSAGAADAARCWPAAITHPRGSGKRGWLLSAELERPRAVE